mmetsp:Transcript_9962/g.18178  ORF Transcript_9962/g.18178 Transcript_9962/m.18178 type:complete len:89 (+) Transcript_9962:1158-1424(+)
MLFAPHSLQLWQELFWIAVLMDHLMMIKTGHKEEGRLQWSWLWEPLEQIMPGYHEVVSYHRNTASKITYNYYVLPERYVGQERIKMRQ